MGVTFGISVASNQLAYLQFKCMNQYNTYYGHYMTLTITSTGMLLWDNTTSSTIWTK